MAAEIFMPQLGLTMSEGKIVKWLKKVGDRVERGEPVFEVETDKVTQEVTSLDAGIVGQLLAEEGSTVPVGTVIGYLAAPGEMPGRGGSGDTTLTPTLSQRERGEVVSRGERGDVLSQRERNEVLPLPTGEGRGEGSTVRSSGLDPSSSPGRSSPAARVLARKLGVDIATLTGTGPSGRIVEADVRRAAEGTGPESHTVTPPLHSPASPPASPQAGGRLELTGVRRVVAERMAYSFSTAPHFYLTVEADAASLVALRQQIAPTLQRKQGVDLTLTDLLVKVVAIALREHPEANAAWAEGAVRLNPAVNVGVAAAVGEGLMVPVIQEADRLSLAEIARKRESLVERARSGRLTLPELEGGSFTVSNLGMFGIDQFQAIVNPPQAAILAVGRIKERVVAVNGQVAVRPTMFVTLSCDHRVVDGVMAARFLARVVELIENPAAVLLVE